jgi:hypothetical protein
MRPYLAFLVVWACAWAIAGMLCGPATGENGEIKRALLSGIGTALGGLAVALVWYVRGGERR